jgi:hypothetical protein
MLFVAIAVALLSLMRNVGELAEAVTRLNTARDTVTLLRNEFAPLLTLQTPDGTLVSTAWLARAAF